MNFTLIRDTFTDRSTAGELFDENGEHVCYTLELSNNDGLPGSCIPRGTYRVKLMPSSKFMLSEDAFVKRFAANMPHVEGIPNRSLIMLHWGNLPADTDGCILVGEKRSADSLGNSRAAFEKLYAKMKDNDTLVVVGGAMQQRPADLSAQGDV